MVNKFSIPLLMGVVLLSLGGCDSPEEKHEKYIQRGDQYLKEHDYIHARVEYKNAAKINPTNPKVIYSLGLVEEAQGNLQAALSAFMTAEQQDMNFEPVVQKLAEFFLTARQDEEAMIRIDRLLSLYPENSMGHALNASLLLKKKDFVAAERGVNRALELDKKNIVAYSVLSGIHVAQSEHEKALAVLDEGLKHSDDVSLYLLKAVIYADLNDLENVQSIYQKIFEINPDRIGYRLDLAQILSTSKKLKEAEDILRLTVSRFPESEEAMRKLIALVEQEKGMSSAETEIKTLIKKSPDQTTLYLWLADLYIRNKRDDLAVFALKNILEAPGEEWVGLTANTSMARIKLSQGDIALAKNLIETVLSKDINNGEALLLRANLALSQGNHEQALGDIRNVIRDNPKSAQAARSLTEILVFQGKQDLAIDTLLQYHNHVPDDLGAQVRLAQLHAMKGDTKQAFEILTKIAENDPSFLVAWETLARLAIENKLFDRADKAISHLADAPNQEAMTLFLKGQLQEAKKEKNEALVFYKQIIEQYPKSPLIEYALSGILVSASSQEDLATIEGFLKDIPTQSPSLTTVLGGVQVALGKTEEAIATLNLALTQKPQSQAAYISLAEILRKNNRIDEALSILERAEKDLPFEPKASLMRAEILVSNGEANKAIRLYEDLLEKHKGSQMSDAIANNFAQTIADHQSDDKEALEKARLVAERFMNSDNPYFLDTLGWVYYKQGNLAAAEPLLKKAKSLLKTPNEQIEKHYQEVVGEKDE